MNSSINCYQVEGFSGRPSDKLGNRVGGPVLESGDPGGGEGNIVGSSEAAERAVGSHLGFSR